MVGGERGEDGADGQDGNDGEDGQNGQDGEKGFDGNSSKWTMIPVGQTPVQGQISFGQQKTSVPQIGLLKFH